VLEMPYRLPGDEGGETRRTLLNGISERAEGRRVMVDWQKVIAIGLACCMMVLPLGDAAVFGATASPGPAGVKQQIGQFGVGAKVKLQLADGKKLKGSISAIEDEAFLLTSKQEGSPQRVAYDQVAQLNLTKLTYKAAGQPDPAEARRVVLGLGVGKHIVVKTADGKEYHGLIVAIDEGRFTIMPDKQAAVVQIAYTDIMQLGPNLSRAAKVVMIVAIAVAGGIALFVYAMYHQNS
jgi:ribosome maturation factor RimP